MSRSTTPPTGRRSREQRNGDAKGTTGGSTAVRYLRRGLNSGAFAGIAAVVTGLRARRTLRQGSSDRATRQSLLAVFWIGVAMTQWGINRADRQEARAGTIGAGDADDIATGGESTPIDVTNRNRTSDDSDSDPDETGEAESSGEEPTDAEGVERARDAEGMEDVEDAAGVTTLDETRDSHTRDDHEE